MSTFETFLLNILSTFYTPVNESEFEVISDTQPNSQTKLNDDENNVWIKFPLLTFLKNKLESKGFQLRRTNDTCLIKYKRNFDFDTSPESDVIGYFRSFCFDPVALVENIPNDKNPTEDDLRKALRESYLSLAPPRAEDYKKFVESLSEQDKKSVVIEEFVDGVMINKFFHRRLNQWMISTRSIVGGQNNINNKEITIQMMFDEASNNSKLDDTKLNTDYSYSFILCHPNARVVKRYSEASLFLVDTFNRSKQFERIPYYKISDTNVKLPEIYQMTLEEMEFKLESGELPFDFQGYVIRLGNRRTRYRNPDFEYVRSMCLAESDPIMRFLHLRRNRQIGSVNEQPTIPKGWLNYFPEDNKFFERLRNNVQSLTNDLHNYYLATNCYAEGRGKITREKVPYYLRSLMKLLHQHYLQSEDPTTGKRQPTTERSVIQFINTEAPIFEISRALIFKQKELEEFQQKQLLEAQEEQRLRQEFQEQRRKNNKKKTSFQRQKVYRKPNLRK